VESAARSGGNVSAQIKILVAPSMRSLYGVRVHFNDQKILLNEKSDLYRALSAKSASKVV